MQLGPKRIGPRRVGPAGLQMGYASALAWILFAIILVITLIQLAASRRWVYYETA